jgi:hypothetical protein
MFELLIANLQMRCHNSRHSHNIARFCSLISIHFFILAIVKQVKVTVGKVQSGKDSAHKTIRHTALCKAE